MLIEIPEQPMTDEQAATLAADLDAQVRANDATDPVWNAIAALAALLRAHGA